MAPESGSTGLTIDKKELRPGLVLFAELPGMSGMKAGYVLSQADIDKIQSASHIQEIHIIDPALLEKARRDIDGIEQAPDRYTRADLARSEVSDDIRQASLHDPQADEKLGHLVGIKKDIIRGEDYEQNRHRYRQEKLAQFSEVLKSTPGQLRTQALRAIDDYSISAADLDGLSAIEAADTRRLVEKLNRYERSMHQFLDAVLSQKTVFTAFVEEIVVDFLNDVGYKLARALFTSISKNEQFHDYLAAHSLQVMIVSLITAIELTRMIQEKSNSLAANDVDTFLAVSQKFFSLEELINLGIGAMLHDIEIRNKYPYLSLQDEPGYEWESILALHPSNGYHIAKSLNIDFDVQRSVYQHHERFDGSGYPNGLYPRFFTKYTPIIMFAEHYIEMTTPNPFDRNMRPARDALVFILSQERMQLDGDVVYAFIRAASLFPVGSWLLLSDGHTGVVTDVNKDRLDRPILRIFFDKTLQRVTPFDLDLAKETHKIIKPIDLPTIKKLAGTSMNFIFE